MKSLCKSHEDSPFCHSVNSLTSRRTGEENRRRKRRRRALLSPRNAPEHQLQIDWEQTFGAWIIRHSVTFSHCIANRLETQERTFVTANTNEHFQIKKPPSLRFVSFCFHWFRRKDLWKWDHNANQFGKNDWDIGTMNFQREERRKRRENWAKRKEKSFHFHWHKVEWNAVRRQAIAKRSERFSKRRERTETCCADEQNERTAMNGIFLFRSMSRPVHTRRRPTSRLEQRERRGCPSPVFRLIAYNLR